MSDIDRINAYRFESQPTLFEFSDESDAALVDIDPETDEQYALRCAVANGVLQQAKVSVVTEVNESGQVIETPTTIDEGRGYN